MRRLAGACVAIALVTGACSSSHSGTSGPGGGTTIKIGLLTAVTGLGASGDKSSVQGVEAGIARAAKEGYKIKLFVGDDQTSPTGAFSAVTKLVEQDNVSVVIAVSAVTFLVSSYLATRHIPVVGVNIDGTEWAKATNMFSVFGYVDESKVPRGPGRFLKMEGGTVIGTVGYGISPSSSESAKATAISAQVAGLKVGYVNATFPFGSTNVGPIVLAMKSAGVNAIYSSTDPNTSFALVTALKQLGVNVKVADFPDGYGGDLSQAGPGAIQAAQGATFSSTFEPVEMHTAATEQFQTDLKSVGVTSEPTEAEYEGYASIAALVDALKITGANPTRLRLITALSRVKDFDADGLLGNHGFDLNDRTGTAAGPGGCDYYAKLVGTTFRLVPGADPLCAGLIPGKTVSPGA